MNESARTTVKCQDPGDGSGDVIIDLPDDILERMGLNIGDFLTIELIGGSIVLKPIRDADPQP
nr:AbrB/MazE/SpoVT family DNA-binding domain-containing protein [Pseudomonas chlororaphis]